MAHKGASVGRGLPDHRGIWDEEFAPAERPDFDFPRRRITGGKGRSAAERPTNGHGGAASANGRTANGNGHMAGANGNGHDGNGALGVPEPVVREAASSRRPGEGVPGRRTVTISGHGAERNLPWAAGQSRRRPAQPRHQRPGFRADRAAMWAVLLGIMLVVVAAASSHAAVLRAVNARAVARTPASAVHVAAPRAVALPRRAAGS